MGNNEYVLVDKQEGIIIKHCTDLQDAWSSWQDCWMGKGNTCELQDRFTFGQYKNMKKYLIQGREK